MYLRTDLQKAYDQGFKFVVFSPDWKIKCYTTTKEEAHKEAGKGGQAFALGEHAREKQKKNPAKKGSHRANTHRGMNYPFFVVDADGKIAAGYDYREDAVDFVKDNSSFALKVMARMTWNRLHPNEKPSDFAKHGTNLQRNPRLPRNSAGQFTKRR